MINKSTDIHKADVKGLISISEFELLSISDDDTLKIIDTQIFRTTYDIYFKN